MADQSVVHLGQEACTSVSKADLGSDVPWHASSAHLRWKLWCVSITVALLQSILCPSSIACCVTANKFTSLTQVPSYVPSDGGLECDLFGRCTPW